MTVNEAVQIMKDAKSKRKGIDSDSKELLKKLIKEGDFDEDHLDSEYYLNLSASQILRIKENDYFDSKQIGRLFLEEAEKMGMKDPKLMTFMPRLTTVAYTDDDEWTGGLNDKSWASKIIDFIMSNIKIEYSSDLIEIADVMKDSLDDKEGALKILIKNSDKMCNMAHVVNLANEIFDNYGELEQAKKIIENAKTNNLPFDEEDDLNYLRDELKS